MFYLITCVAMQCCVPVGMSCFATTEIDEWPRTKVRGAAAKITTITSFNNLCCDRKILSGSTNYHLYSNSSSDLFKGYNVHSFW